MPSETPNHVQKLVLACAVQAAIVAAKQDGLEAIAFELEDLLADIQPGFLLAA